jgi:hypothetical protein
MGEWPSIVDPKYHTPVMANLYLRSKWQGLSRKLGELERPVHSAEQPADAKRYDRHGIGLGFDSPAKPLVKSGSGVACGICRLPV